MTFEFPRTRNVDPLTKSEKLKLHGGMYRGEYLFLSVDRGPHCGPDWYYVKVRNQMRSRKYPSHPDGYLFLRSRVFSSSDAKWFQYDIASSTCCMDSPDVYYKGTPYRRLKSLPALLFQPRADTEGAQLMRMASEATEARELLFNAILKNPGDVDTVADLMAEVLGVKRDTRIVERSGHRILRYLPHINTATATALTGAILAASERPSQPQLPVAA